MKSEDLDKLVREKVSSLKGLPPDISWDRESAWERLNDNSGNSVRSNAKWYKFAAASVVVLILKTQKIVVAGSATAKIVAISAVTAAITSAVVVTTSNSNNNQSLLTPKTQTISNKNFTQNKPVVIDTIENTVIEDVILITKEENTFVVDTLELAELKEDIIIEETASTQEKGKEVETVDDIVVEEKSKIKSLDYNYIKNNSFEDNKGLPSNYVSKPKHFTITNWNIPNRSTPDIYGYRKGSPMMNYPYHKKIKPRSGNVCVGIYTYYKAESKHDYIQNKLAEPLVPGEIYYVEFWVKRSSDEDLASNNIGAYFGTTKYNSNSKNPIFTRPHINQPQIIENSKQWTCISGTFVADKEYKYMIIGNFYSDIRTQIVNCKDSGRSQSYATKKSYYFIDDVLVRRLE